ncbi:hypothetical protein [Noviherbaspirillum galbum]|uniref:Uncharacterized protein n=1 Tax=Noviherbaspirillum galbum TaxID=2709383 RepID=A0A6B3SQQ2_9BURK|nr:hypothetical protein [Noviherbaspirillum galbum]NEX59989.1 hypothetical protein [Noviherbaspirillum galbum]
MAGESGRRRQGVSQADAGNGFPGHGGRWRRGAKAARSTGTAIIAFLRALVRTLVGMAGIGNGLIGVRWSHAVMMAIHRLVMLVMHHRGFMPLRPARCLDDRGHALDGQGCHQQAKQEGLEKSGHGVSVLRWKFSSSSNDKPSHGGKVKANRPWCA